MLLRKSALIGMLLVATVGPALYAKTDAASEARKAIQAAYDKEAAAAAKRDVDGMYAAYSPDWVGEDSQGTKKTLAEELKEAKATIPIVVSLKSARTITRISLKGNEAVVNTKEHDDGVLKPPDSNKTVKMVVDETSQDTWVKISKGWLQTKSRTLTEKMTLDGKPFPPQETPQKPSGNP